MKKLVLAILAGTAFIAPDAMACLTIPAPSNVITSLYGWRFHPVAKTWRLHRGADFRATMSTSLVAAQSGVIQISSSASGGNELRILGADGTVTRYLHLTRAIVDPGTRVSAGQPIALSGNTGHASAAPHLHFEVYRKGGGDVNPEPLLCAGTVRKPGADMVDGFPIRSCNPDGGQCVADGGSGASLPPASSQPSASAGSSSGSATASPAAGGATASPAGTAAVPAPTIEAFDDVSTAEVFSAEVGKRFANPDWYKDQAERSTVPLIVEYLHMKALEAYMELHRRQLKERIETLMATRLARRSRADIEPRLDRQRQSAAKAD